MSYIAAFQWSLLERLIMTTQDVASMTTRIQVNHNVRQGTCTIIGKGREVNDTGRKNNWPRLDPK
jgi:hypothetical protein